MKGTAYTPGPQQAVTECRRAPLVLVGVGIASFLGCIDLTIVNTALPAIRAEFDIGMTQLQWVITAFIIALSSLMVTVGRIADLYGRRRLLYAGLAVFGAASLAAALAGTFLMLVLARFAQGIGCAVLYTVSGAIVANAYPEAQRGKALGVLFGMNGLGLALGPVLGGIVVGLASWRWIFLLNIPLILVSYGLCLISVRESRGTAQRAKLDIPGAILLGAALPMLIFGLSQVQSSGWLNLVVIGLLVGAVALLALFYVVECRSTSPIVEFKLFKNHRFIGSVIATFFLAFFYCPAFFLMPAYLHDVLQLPDMTVGLLLLPTTGLVAALSPVVGRLVDRKGPVGLLVAGFACLALSALMQANLSVDGPLGYMLTAFALMGIGWACILGPSTAASLAAVPERIGAVAMGSAWTLHNIGGALGLAAGASIVAASKSSVTEPQYALVTGYSYAMWLLVGSSLIATTGIWLTFCRGPSR